MKKSLPVIKTLLLCGILSVALAIGGFIASKYVSSGSSPSAANETSTEQPLPLEPVVSATDPVIPEAPAPEPQAAITPVVPELRDAAKSTPEEQTEATVGGAEVPNKPNPTPVLNSPTQPPLNDIEAVKAYLSKLPLTAIGPKGILIDRDLIAWGGKLGPEDEITLVKKVGVNGNQVIFSAFGETVLLKF